MASLSKGKKMKTLDEVISTMEYEAAYNGGEARGYDPDALYYLKEYRTEQKILSDSKKHYEYWEHIYYTELEKNNPLTWDELCTMEGKPVWVVQHHGDTKGWLLILRKYNDVVTCTTKHGNSFYLYKANYGEKWQAYRKESE